MYRGKNELLLHFSNDKQFRVRQKCGSISYTVFEGGGGEWPLIQNKESKKTILSANGTDWSGMHDH